MAELYEVVMNFEYKGQSFINRFTYKVSGTPAAVSKSFAAANGLGFIQTAGLFSEGSLPERVLSVMNSGCSLAQVTVQSIYDLSDFYSTPYTTGNTGNGSAFTHPTLAVAYRTSLVTRAIRRGKKRFGGVDGTLVNSDGTLKDEAAVNAVFEALRVTLGYIFPYNDEGNVLTLTPVILGRQKKTVNGKSYYDYYDTEAEQMSHLFEATTWELYPELRTQTSRQYRRGQ